MTDIALLATQIAKKPYRTAIDEIAALPEGRRSDVLAELARRHPHGSCISEVVARLPMIVCTMSAELAGI